MVFNQYGKYPYPKFLYLRLIDVGESMINSAHKYTRSDIFSGTFHEFHEHFPFSWVLQDNLGTLTQWYYWMLPHIMFEILLSKAIILIWSYYLEPFSIVCYVIWNHNFETPFCYNRIQFLFGAIPTVLYQSGVTDFWKSVSIDFWHKA